MAGIGSGTSFGMRLKTLTLGGVPVFRKRNKRPSQSIIVSGVLRKCGMILERAHRSRRCSFVRMGDSDAVQNGRAGWPTIMSTMSLSPKAGGGAVLGQDIIKLMAGCMSTCVHKQLPGSSAGFLESGRGQRLAKRPPQSDALYYSSASWHSLCCSSCIRGPSISWPHRLQTNTVGRMPCLGYERV
jgi:hypothetical protein